MTNSRKGQQGFLLIEMLIALSVVAVMATLMSRFLGQMGAIVRLEAEISAQGELDAAATYLKKTIEAARPLRLLDAEENTSPLMDGKSNSIKLASVTRGGLNSLALRDIEIRLVNEAGDLKLVHTITPRRIVNGKAANARPPVVIVDNIASLEFEYGANASWSDSWKKDGLLPSGVRLTLTRNAGRKTVSVTKIARISRF